MVTPASDSHGVAAPDAVMTRVGAAMALAATDRAGAKEMFARIWDDIGEHGDAFHRVALAHSMADVQDDTHDELAWDLRALAAADELTDERAAVGGVVAPVRAFYPSLHLNLGEAYRKLGRVDEATEHCRLGRAATDALPADGYGDMVRNGLARLDARIRSLREADDHA